MKNEKGSAKYVSTQIKRGQRTKIRYYCGLCQIACKDENGYKCHLETEGHLLRELAAGESLRTFNESGKDTEFKNAFIEWIVKRHYGQTVLAHDIYRDIYPLDRGHNIIKETCWGTLGVFIAQLRKEGRIEAQKGLKGWQIRISSSGEFDTQHIINANNDTKVAPKREPKLVRETVREHIRVEPHETATERQSGEKVVFGLIKSVSAPTKKPIPSAFANDSDESNSPHNS